MSQPRPALGLTTYAYYWAATATERPFTPEDLLERAAALGLSVIQYCENLPLVGRAPEELARFRAAAESRGIRLEPGVRGLDEAVLRAGLETAAALGSPLLRVVPWSGAVVQRRMSGAALFEALRPLVPVCHRLGVALAVENYFDIRDDELAACIRQFDDPLVGVCLDTANSTGFLQEPLATIDLLAPYALSLHLKDYAVLKPAMGYRVVGVPLGDGWLDVPAALERVFRAGRSPDVLLELWVDPAASAEETLGKEDAWVRQSADYARHLLAGTLQPASVT